MRPQTGELLSIRLSYAAPLGRRYRPGHFDGMLSMREIRSRPTSDRLSSHPRQPTGCRTTSTYDGRSSLIRTTCSWRQRLLSEHTSKVVSRLLYLPMWTHKHVATWKNVHAKSCFDALNELRHRTSCYHFAVLLFTASTVQFNVTIIVLSFARH